MTSGPRPLTWNLGKLNPAKRGLTGLSLKGEGQAEEVSGRAGNTKSQRKMPLNGNTAVR